MTDTILLLMLCLLFVFGYRLMARLDYYLFSGGKKNLRRLESMEKRPSPRELLNLYFTGESLRDMIRLLGRNFCRKHGKTGHTERRRRGSLTRNGKRFLPLTSAGRYGIYSPGSDPGERRRGF